MNLKYTIIEGTLNGEMKQCEIPFALVFEENGIYFLETFLPVDFFEKNDFSKKYNLTGKTEKGYKIEIKDLTYSLYQGKNRKAKFVCRNYLKLTKENNISKELIGDREDSILFIEIEGFNTKFSDYTDVKKIRQYGEVDDFDINFDHTSCSMYAQIDGFRENYFHLVFSKSVSNDLISIDFTKNSGQGILTFKHYQKLKKQFIGFLSLINGGDVYVRRELTGKTYKVDGSDSQIVYIYSFFKKNTSNTSHYIPINDNHSYSSSIFQNAFLECFNNFYHSDIKLDLVSIISSLNASFTTSGIQQSYSILINALEKLCSNYQKSNENLIENYIPNELWENTIKDNLIKVLKAYKPQINSNDKNNFSIFNSKIGDLNRRKNSTVEKMYELFKFGCIPINENVNNLINKERHTAVHNGEFGKNSTEEYINYLKLDHILRDLILNIIDYRSYRKHTYEYATIEERRKAYPKRKKEPVTYVCSQPYRK
ncbi:hypothetical protein SAMN05444411_1371 [Lutibacter oricola]|uniref:ApeA N-terminal domain-containing protein n=1 Tax=Lutibacter oricola TaxID=762486 RepID=A0A1H3HHU4_9FLAO|nr:hypothetical protein [Lutibacter oricola]SDY14239.1 hypothetical protein SAMN05444411_1371 [Lutibacter oricola]